MKKWNRTHYAGFAAVAMVIFGIVAPTEAFHAIDWNTIALLLGMMVLVQLTGETGVFHYVGLMTAKWAKGDPIRILIMLMWTTAICSAFLDNVTTVLLLTPVTFYIAKQLQVAVFPYLLSQIIASNVGGTATLIGDPPNILIGSADRSLTFVRFIVNLAPVCILILLIITPIFVWLFRGKLRTTHELRTHFIEMDSSNIIRHRRLLGAALVCLAATFAGFSLHTLFHVPPGAVALMGASALAIYAGPRRVGVALRQIEWETLLFFFSLFILVGALVGTGLLGKLAALTMHAANGSVGVTSMLILWTSAFASSAVDNIPFVATMIPFIQELGKLGIHDTEPLWWSLALGACLGGNGTLIGASANIVVAGLAEREGEKLSFGRYLKYGFPFMLLSIGISSLYVYFRYIF